MRSQWGWIPVSLFPRNIGSPRRNPTRAGRFYRLGVERLEDRHLLNAGPLSIVGDAALSLLPTLNSVASDVRLSHGPEENHGSQVALENHSQKMDRDETLLSMSVSQTTTMGNDVVSSKLSVEVIGPNPPQVSVSMSVTVAPDEGSGSYAPSNLLMVPNNASAPRPAMGQMLLVRLDQPGPPVETSAGARAASNVSDPNKFHAEHENAPPELSALAMTALKIEAREAVIAAGEEFHHPAASLATVLTNHVAPLALLPGSREIELVAIAMTDLFGAHFSLPGVEQGEANAGGPVAAGAVPVEDDVVAMNFVQVAAADHALSAKASVLPVDAIQTALLESMPVDVRAVDRALSELLDEIESLGGELSSWLDASEVSPWNLAAGTAVATGVGGLWFRRTRLRRARQQQLDEESTSWLFTQSRGLATGSTL